MDPNKLNRSCSMQLAPATTAAVAAIVRLPLVEMDLRPSRDSDSDKDKDR